MFGGVGLGVSQRAAMGWEGAMFGFAAAPRVGLQVNGHARIFFDVYGFFFRLYHRLRVEPTKRDFNKITSYESNGKTFFRVTNYDYKMFKWAKEAGFADTISNDCIDFLGDRLTTNQRRAFERRIGD